MAFKGEVLPVLPWFGGMAELYAMAGCSTDGKRDLEMEEDVESVDSGWVTCKVLWKQRVRYKLKRYVSRCWFIFTWTWCTPSFPWCSRYEPNSPENARREVIKNKEIQPKYLPKQQEILIVRSGAISSWLWEYLLPYIHPLLLLVGKRLVRISEGGREDIPHLGTQELKCQHRFPIVDWKPDTVAIDDNDTRVQLISC